VSLTSYFHRVLPKPAVAPHTYTRTTTHLCCVTHVIFSLCTAKASSGSIAHIHIAVLPSGTHVHMYKGAHMHASTHKCTQQSHTHTQTRAHTHTSTCAHPGSLFSHSGGGLPSGQYLCGSARQSGAALHTRAHLHTAIQVCVRVFVLPERKLI